MDKNKKRALAAAGVAGVAGVAGIAAANMQKKANENVASNGIPAYVHEADSENDIKVTKAVSDLGVVTTAPDSSKSSETTSATMIGLSDYGISLSDYRNMKAGTTETQTTDSFTDTDTVCYEVMKDTIARLSSFDVNYESMSLADMIISNYGVELSPKQAARYDRLMNQTYMAYSEAIACYNNGDVSGFRRRYTEIINGQFLNLDDLIDILSININLQGDYIKNSSNYSISDGKLIIDGITLESLFPEATDVDYFDVMSLISFYGKDGNSNDRVLDILQTPVFIIGQAIRPTNMTLVNSNTVYAYDNSKLKEFFDNVNNDYCSKLGLNHFGFEVNNGSREIFGYDENNNKHLIGNNDMYRSGLGFYLVMLDQYRKSEHARVGHFSGLTMKCFIYEFEKGIDNVNVPGMYEVFDNNEYENNGKIR